MTTGRINQVTVVFRTLFFRTEIQKKKVEEKKRKRLNASPTKKSFSTFFKKLFSSRHDLPLQHSVFFVKERRKRPEVWSCYPFCFFSKAFS